LSGPRQVIRPLVRSNFPVIKPYIPGRPVADVMREFGLTDVVKLASNENPAGPSPLATAAIAEALGDLHRYPDGAAQEIRAAIARHVGLSNEHVFVGNGSDEIIKLIAETFLGPEDEVLLPFPSFVSYTLSAAMTGTNVVHAPLTADFQYDLDAIVQRVTERTKVIYLCTPNNPTGTWLTHHQVESLLARLPERILVVCDEAYHEYLDTPDPLDSLRFVRAGRPLISLRTFSKMYGLAGLRIGYALGDPGVLGFLHQVRLPFNVNSLAQAGAVAALADSAHVVRSRALNAAGRSQYESGLAQLGLRYIPSQGNFLLVHVGDGQAVFTALQRLGVIVRAGFPGLSEYIRISIGSETDNARCLEALAAVL